MLETEVLRVGGSIVWIAILLVFRRQAWRTVRAPSEVQPWEVLMGATWLLAVNRLAFSAIGQFDAGDADAFNLCQAFAFTAGLLMLLVGIWARYVGNR